jgi:hypothetical protein
VSIQYIEEGLLPVSLDRLWSFLREHEDPAILPRIHSELLSERIVERKENETLADRVLRTPGGARRSVWKLTYAPPTSFRWEILESEGPFQVGSFLVNEYAEVPGGVRVRSEGRVAVRRIPDFLARGPLRKGFERIHSEDTAYLLAHP